MDIFDRARKALGDLAQSASDQARQLRMQADMGQIEEDMERNLVEAGRRARQLWRRGSFADTDFEVLMRRVDELEAELERLRLESLQMGKTAAAPAAGQQAAPPPSPEPLDPRPAGGEGCSQCGAELKTGDRFCSSCGQAVD